MDLLRQACPSLLQEQLDSWELKLFRHFPVEMLVACQTRSVNLMRELCRRYEELPGPTTAREFVEQGIALADPLQSKTRGSKAVLYHATQGSVPLVLKKLSEDEHVGYVAIDKIDSAQRKQHHLAPFTLFLQGKSPVTTPAPSPPADLAAASSGPAATQPTAGAAPLSSALPQGNSLNHIPVRARREGASAAAAAASGGSEPPAASRLRDWAAMPHYPTTLDSFARPLEGAVATKLMAQMVRALDFLHGSDDAPGLAHMDVKVRDDTARTSATRARGHLRFGARGSDCCCVVGTVLCVPARQHFRRPAR